MIDLIGKIFGRLKVIKYYGNYKYECLCDCGITKIINRYSLLNGSTKSCGCLFKEKLKIGMCFKHGHNKRGKASTTYRSWQHMIQRCTNPNYEDYKHYGGRGITVCERWLPKNNGYENFLEDMGERPPGLSLDRINNNKLIDGYSPDNCRWATTKEQNNNQRRSKIKFFFSTLSLKEFYIFAERFA